jgi:hypothetical protein
MLFHGSFSRYMTVNDIWAVRIAPNEGGGGRIQYETSPLEVSVYKSDTGTGFSEYSGFIL